MNISGLSPQICLNTPIITPPTSNAFCATTIGVNISSILSSCCQHKIVPYGVVSGIPCFLYCNLTQGADFNAVQQCITSTPGILGLGGIATECGPAQSRSTPSLVLRGNILGLVVVSSLLVSSVFM
ncbi:hypothetical protein BT63DRAFT_199034 [Microthyrium microscopicum]|uniref:Uncharacterized protein n=1 Tax=Microthyrium microscopicum TaxID=703497 RepID=A0A6A6UK05_9PEZI|nr:hypothetical protein BT63DRAFT_199034 [Microthyrium microscopicum]